MESEVAELKKDKKLKKSSRNLFLADFSGGELLGAATGLGGYYKLRKGKREFHEQISDMEHDEKTGLLKIVMAKKRVAGTYSQVNQAVHDLEQRIKEFKKTMSSKILRFQMEMVE